MSTSDQPFQTQEDCWRALVNGAKLTCQERGSNEYVHFVGGKLVRQDGSNEYSGLFGCPSDWHVWEPATVTGWRAMAVLEMRTKGLLHPSTGCVFCISDGETFRRDTKGAVTRATLIISEVLNTDWLEVSL